MRSPALTPIRALVGTASFGTRVRLGLTVLIGVVARLSVIATARTVVGGDLTRTTAVAVVVGAALAIQRILQAQVRVGVECDLHRAVAVALIESDVLIAPTRDVQRTVFDGEHHARTLVGTALPSLLSDVLVSLVVGPLLALLLPLRVLVLGGVALGAVLIVLLALRRTTEQLQTRMMDAAQRVYDRMLIAIEGRLELVARGGEAAYRSDLARSLGSYSAVAGRAALRSAVLGRIPIVVGIALVAVVVGIDAASRRALTAAVFGDALVLVACVPPLIGVVVGLHEVFRNSALVGPLVSLLASQRRPELERDGEPPPKAPRVVAFRRVSFAYDPASRAILEDVDGEWTAGHALLVEGSNGAGKSTFLRLLLGLRVPTSGAIELDGVDLQRFDLTTYRQRIAYLPQQPYLGEAHVTVRAALEMARPDASPAAMTAALERVALLDALVARHEQPLDVVVAALSAGQRQRVALARVLLTDAALVILDEPDAYLDSDGVALVVALVDDLVAAGRLVAIVAHSRAFTTSASVRLKLP